VHPQEQTKQEISHVHRWPIIPELINIINPFSTV